MIFEDQTEHFGAPHTFSLFDVGQIDLHSGPLQVQTGIPHVRISSPLVLHYKFLGYVMLFFFKILPVQTVNRSIFTWGSLPIRKTFI